MTPGARVAAAITVLDRIREGAFAEQALTAWARGSRFAGAKDRAAVRDHVFDVLRAKHSLGNGDGRALMLRLLHRDNADIESLFNGIGHAPKAMDQAEAAALSQPLQLSEPEACDIPDWLWPVWQASLGPDANAAAAVQQTRADVFLRVNLRRGSMADAAAALAQDGIGTQPHSHVATCLRVRDNPRRVKTSAAYLDGLVELQDASSQRAVGLVPPAARLLDYCAGGGGKALAFADRPGTAVFAHDIAPQRMADLPDRAARAGVAITCLPTADLRAQAPFDLVFCDAPCSGSGTWRRSPDAKWRLTPERLAELCAIQAQVIADAAALVGAGGLLAYATCSVLQPENDGIIDGFLARHPAWTTHLRDLVLPGPDGDGFYLHILRQ